MKKTVYFTSQNVQTGQLALAIQNAVEQRDAWLESEKESIGKIDFEDLKILPWAQGNQHVMVTILMTYYPK